MTTQSPSDQPDPSEDSLSFIETVLSFQDGTLDAEALAALDAEINRNPARRALFIQLQHQSAGIRELLRRDAFGVIDQNAPTPSISQKHSRSYLRSWSVRLAALSAVIAILLLFIPISEKFGVRGIKERDVAMGTGIPVDSARHVLMEEGARALFFGRGPMTPGSALSFREDYMLLQGMVRVAFPTGARAIIEAPALFRILDENKLAMDTGSCSVHAPAGAEGFAVITPITNIVDRGTRFSVRVHDNSETDVHVIEGAADLYPSDEFQKRAPSKLVENLQMIPEGGLRLTDMESIRVAALKDDSREALTFNPGDYHSQLPDRVISYQASSGAEGVEELESITVRRAGITHTYSVDNLIPIELTAFRSDPGPDRNGHLAGGPELPLRPQELLEDRKLNTGVINPGGQPAAPSYPLVGLPGNTDLPGLGFRFQRPVINGPGPDVVFFEVQCLPNLLDGDPFHLIPVEDRPGLKVHTVKEYDLTLNSLESLKVQPFYLHRYSGAVNSLEELATSPSQVNIGVLHLRFHALAVAVDLSDLGYQEGDQVTELFIQHASEENESRIDLVYIAGFPEVAPTARSPEMAADQRISR